MTYSYDIIINNTNNIHQSINYNYNIILGQGDLFNFALYSIGIQYIIILYSAIYNILLSLKHPYPVE